MYAISGQEAVRDLGIECMEYISAMILSPLLDIFRPLELSNDTVTLPALSGRAGEGLRRFG